MLLEMRMPDPIPTFSALATRLRDSYPDLAFLHVVEPRIAGGLESTAPVDDEESNDFLREIWTPKPFITAGNYERNTALERADTKCDLIAFGRYYISNVCRLDGRRTCLLTDVRNQPDLVTRLQRDIPLAPYNYSTFYTPESPEGYIDYLFYDEANA